MKLRQWLSEHKDVTQTEFAARIGVSAGYVSRLCDDKDGVTPSLQIAAKIQEATGGEVTMAEFLPSAAA